MGYACPVCGTPQADKRHLADHIAVTAMVHGDDHETFLEDHVEGWSSMGPDELGPVVAELATEAEYPRLFEDTTDHDHGRERLEDHLEVTGQGPRASGRGDLSASGKKAIARAREMTREMLDEGDEADDEEETDG